MNAWCEYNLSIFIHFKRGFSQSTTKYASKDMRKSVFYLLFFKHNFVSFCLWKNICIGTGRPSWVICIYRPLLPGQRNLPEIWVWTMKQFILTEEQGFILVIWTESMTKSQNGETLPKAGFTKKQLLMWDQAGFG